jgi:hypothetical protein
MAYGLCMWQGGLVRRAVCLTVRPFWGLRRPGPAGAHGVGGACRRGLRRGTGRRQRSDPGASMGRPASCRKVLGTAVMQACPSASPA